MKCEEDINECKEDDPCAENNIIECVNSYGSYECRCENGWEGEDCTEEKKYCEEDELCLNGGTCNENYSNENGYTCSCEGTGFEGPNCENDIKECLTSPCENGECEELTSGTFFCNCGATGYYGDLCEFPCKGDNGNCLNGGTCEVSRVESQRVISTKCKCAEGFEGDLCETMKSLKRTADETWVMIAIASLSALIVFVFITLILLVSRSKACKLWPCDNNNSNREDSNQPYDDIGPVTDYSGPNYVNTGGSESMEMTNAVIQVVQYTGSNYVREINNNRRAHTVDGPPRVVQDKISGQVYTQSSLYENEYADYSGQDSCYTEAGNQYDQLNPSRRFCNIL